MTLQPSKVIAGGCFKRSILVANEKLEEHSRLGSLADIDTQVIEAQKQLGLPEGSPVVSTVMTLAMDGSIRTTRLHVSRKPNLTIKFSPVKLFPEMDETKKMIITPDYGVFRFHPGALHSEWVDCQKMKPQLMRTQDRTKDGLHDIGDWPKEKMGEFSLRLSVEPVKDVAKVQIRIMALPDALDTLSTKYKGNLNHASYPCIALTETVGYMSNSNAVPVVKDGMPLFPFLIWDQGTSEQVRGNVDPEEVMTALYAMWSDGAGAVFDVNHEGWANHVEGSKEPVLHNVRTEWTWPAMGLQPYVPEDDIREYIIISLDATP